VDVVKDQLRLDKYLADMGIGTRSEVKNYIRKGLIKVNDVTVKKPEVKVNLKEDHILYKEDIIHYVAYEYYMLNKPAGVISASEDPHQETVIDLIDTKMRKDLFPVGRLDKDTEGLLIITNDGVLSHNLLSPKKHVNKTYYAHIEGRVTEEDILAFKKGVLLDDGYLTKPAELTILESNEVSKIELVIYEGKFHQVKRMFESVDKKVVYLKRLKMGDLLLDPDLEIGHYRSLTDDELDLLKKQ
jgi:16S rRNA pseudouridine516 synthase